MKTHKQSVDFVASHGHTVFHQPHKGFTFQLGDGNALHAACKLPVVCDFRSLDVILGGQGAPLVPIGDQLLFPQAHYCLNLGGIANLSYQKNGKRLAFDVCFMNMGLNYLMEASGKKFDKNGTLASSGKLNKSLMTKLSGLYTRMKSKRPSLGREYFEKNIKPLLNKSAIATADKLHTLTESAAYEIASVLKASDNKPTVLISGGGAFNTYFISRLLAHCGDDVTLMIPDEQVVKFKEALIFGFLGVLRVRDETNCLKSVTGALRDNSGGVLIGF